jgi:hypothetical protein
MYSRLPNMALQPTRIPLRSMRAAELGRWALREIWHTDRP